MAHGAYAKRRVAGNRAPSVGRSSRGTSARSKEWDKKAIRNQIRSIERLLKRALPLEIKTAHEKRLEDLKWQTELHVHRKMALRDRKVKFLERRKLERRIRRLEKQHRLNVDQQHHQTGGITSQLEQLKEDLEYVRFFPKTERYVSLFVGSDDELTRSRRNEIREKIKARRAALGNELEETGSEDDEPMDLSEDDAFAEGSSSEDADDADDEWTDNKSSREETSRETGPSPVPHEDPVQQHRERREEFARVLMPPPRSMNRPSSMPSSSTGVGVQSRNRPWSSGRGMKQQQQQQQQQDISSSNSEDAMVRSTSSGVSSGPRGSCSMSSGSKAMEDNEEMAAAGCCFSSSDSNASFSCSQLKKMRTGDV